MATVKEGEVPVRLFNPNHKPARIFRGSTVGKLCQAQDPGEEEDLTEPQSCYHICPSSCEPKSKGASSSTMISQEDNQKRKEAMAEMFEIDNPNLSTEEKETVYEILSRHSAVISTGKTDLQEELMSRKPFQAQLSLLTWTLSVVTGKSEWMKEIERKRHSLLQGSVVQKLVNVNPGLVEILWPKL